MPRLLALVSAGFGKRVLDGLGQSPEHPLDALALALPLGMGLTALATLALGELGWLNRGRFVDRAGRADRAGNRSRGSNWFAGAARLASKRVSGRGSRTSLSLFFAFCTGPGAAGTALTALTPVTDGDALCYHLQVPKVFLMRGVRRVRARPA